MSFILAGLQGIRSDTLAWHSPRRRLSTWIWLELVGTLFGSGTCSWRLELSRRTVSWSSLKTTQLVLCRKNSVLVSQRWKPYLALMALPEGIVELREHHLSSIARPTKCLVMLCPSRCIKQNHEEFVDWVCLWGLETLPPPTWVQLPCLTAFLKGVSVWNPIHAFQSLNSVASQTSRKSFASWGITRNLQGTSRALQRTSVLSFSHKDQQSLRKILRRLPRNYLQISRRPLRDACVLYLSCPLPLGDKVQSACTRNCRHKVLQILT